MTENRLSTGIDELDRQINSGFRPGSIVSIVAPPDSQSEVMLEQISTERKTLYISTSRRETEIKQAFKNHNIPVKNEQIVFKSVNPGEGLVQRVLNLVKRVEEDGTTANVIIDTMNMIELQNDYQDHISFFETMKDAMEGCGGLCILHCVNGMTNPEIREFTLNLSDSVLEVHQDRNGETIDTRLAVPKIRGCKPLKETIKLLISDEVTVDTSRDIA